MRQIADKVGALYLVDMAHFAGLVAGGVHPSPVPHAQIVTTTDRKSTRLNSSHIQKSRMPSSA